MRGAMPAGIVTASAFSTILGELTTRLAVALPLDGLLLALHGAMVADNALDAESHILEAVRAVVGREVPIVVVLDMHGNISRRTVELADVLIAFDENPHVDPYERVAEKRQRCWRVCLTDKILPTAGLCPSAAASGAHRRPGQPIYLCVRFTIGQERWKQKMG